MVSELKMVLKMKERGEMKELSITDYLRKNSTAMKEFSRFKVDIDDIARHLTVDFKNKHDDENDSSLEKALSLATEFAANFSAFLNRIQQENLSNLVGVIESSEYIGAEPLKRAMSERIRVERLLDAIKKARRVKIERTISDAEKALEEMKN